MDLRGGRSNPSVIFRCGSLLLSVSADVRSSDDVIAFEGEDPFLYIDHRSNFHLLYHRMNDGQQDGGHAFSKDGKRWVFGPPAYDASVRYADPVIGDVWFASRERPHLVFEKRESDGVLEIVALTTGVKVCNLLNSTVDDCNSNAWPGYNDKSYTSVQPVRSTRSLP